MANIFHVGDIGIDFLVTISQPGGTSPMNLGTATVMQMVFLSPSGVRSTKTANFATDGSDGVVKYTTQNDDLFEAGKWKYQVIVTFSGGAQFHGPVNSFKVKGNL